MSLTVRCARSPPRLTGFRFPDSATQPVEVRLPYRGAGWPRPGRAREVRYAVSPVPAGQSAAGKFCLECGARVTLTCGNCGTELPAGATFCF